MKSGFISMIALAAACAAVAAPEDTLLTFSTRGPDTYLDGSPVLDGECYALIWTKTGSVFAGLNADGSLVDPTNSLLVLTAPVARDGRCPKVAYQIPKATADACASGTFAVYLLDTRIACGDGTMRLGGVDATGAPANVNGFGAVEDSHVAAADDRTEDAPATTITAVSAVPAETPLPKIKGIKLVGGKVYVTVAKTVPYLQYDLSAGATPARVDARNAALAPVSGSAAEEDVILVAPAEQGRFFRVIRHE
ncbi:MAG: hypothetical protein ACI4Q3_07045 [Kiritimatiellia bacterium]